MRESIANAFFECSKAFICVGLVERTPDDYCGIFDRRYRGADPLHIEVADTEKER